MKIFLTLLYFCHFSLLAFSQDEKQIKLRYWNGATDGIGISNPVGLEVSATKVTLAHSLKPINEATLSGEEPKFHFAKKFALFFTVKNVGTKDVAIYDWAFKAVCPVDNMGRKFDATSMVQLVTPYIPSSIYIILKPGEKKQFYSVETDFYWCLPQDKDDLLHDPEYFQALITCASATGSGTSMKASQKLGNFDLPATPPQKLGNILDSQIEKLIKDHNELIQKNDVAKATTLKARILRIISLAYPSQASLVESKLSKPQTASIHSSTKKEILSFNGNTLQANGDCLEGTASLTSDDESTILLINNLGSNGSFSVNANFYTNNCMNCLAVQLQDITNSKTYIGVSGTINKTAKDISIDLTVKEMMSVIEGNGESHRVTGKIICE